LSLTLLAKIIVIIALIVAWIRIAITGESIKKRWWMYVAVAFLGWNILAPFVFHSSTYEGTVIDEETGKPIVGAVVVVIWYNSPIIHMDQSKRFQNAAETVTENDGSFSIWHWPGISLNPFTYVTTPPNVIIYKAGYKPYQATTEFGGTSKELRKAVTMEEAVSFASPPVAGDVSNYSFPKLIREVNIHRKNMGLTQIP